eukprot:5816109-Prymnesium_polylepis.1
MRCGGGATDAMRRWRNGCDAVVARRDAMRSWRNGCDAVVARRGAARRRGVREARPAWAGVAAVRLLDVDGVAAEDRVAAVNGAAVGCLLYTSDAADDM